MRERGTQYVRIVQPEGLGHAIYINPQHVVFVIECGADLGVIHIHASSDPNGYEARYTGHADAWIKAVRFLNLNPTIPVVDLDPDFRYTSDKVDDLNKAIPDEEATKV